MAATGQTVNRVAAESRGDSIVAPAMLKAFQSFDIPPACRLWSG